jgi:hypothetical protein
MSIAPAHRGTPRSLETTGRPVEPVEAAVKLRHPADATTETGRDL